MSFVNASPLQLAHRDLRRQFSRPVTWAALVGAAVVLSVAGAFDTDQFMGPIPLALYWCAVVTCTYALGTAVSAMLRPALQKRPLPVRILVYGTVSGAVITSFILGANLLAFGAFLPSARALVQFVATTFAITFLISAIIDLAFTQNADMEEAAPRLLDRLPFDKRGALVSLTALDHYVEVTTTKGTEMLLMRLADAITETAPITGLQIHRSHWVALDHVAAVNRSAGKTEVILSDDRRLPVSRGKIDALRAHGLLPKAANG